MKKIFEVLQKRKIFVVLISFIAMMGLFFFFYSYKKHEPYFSIKNISNNQQRLSSEEITYEKLKKKKTKYKKENMAKKVIGKIRLGEDEKSQQEDDLNLPLTWVANEVRDTHFLATIKRSKKVANGESLIELVLLEDAFFKDVELSKGTLLLATAIFRNNRCHLFVTAYRIDKNKTKPIELVAFDEDYQEGVYFEKITDDMYDYAECRVVDEVIKRANFKEITTFARDLYRMYRRKNKIMLHKNRKFYVTENHKKKNE